ncbi:hypothetical protein SUGI_0722840 [Cryptomeria japonica]|nr:hypothetical protein SUGI_0722840 [Cryptomeria japonica]
MTSKRNRKRLIMTAAAAAASALAFYFTWKAFRSYDPDPDEEAPCGEDGDENMMKSNEEKLTKVKGIAEEDSGFRLEEFEEFIAEKYGAVLVEGVKKSLDCQEYHEPNSGVRVEEFEEIAAVKYGAVLVEGIKNSLDCEDSHKPTREGFERNDQEESNLKVGLVMKEGAKNNCLSSFSDGFESWSISNETDEEGLHSVTGQFGKQQFQFYCGRIQGMNSEVFVTEFCNSRDASFDELSMQDLSEGDVIFPFDLQKESDRQTSPDFEFDSRNSTIKNMDMDPKGLGTKLYNMSDGGGLSGQSSEDGYHHEFDVGDFEKPSLLEIKLQEEFDISTSNGVEGLAPSKGLELEILNPVDESLKTSSAIGIENPDHGISAESFKSVEEQVSLSNIHIPSLGGSLTETSNIDHIDCNEADEHLSGGGICSLNDAITGHTNCLLENLQGQNSPADGFDNMYNSNTETSSLSGWAYHLHQQPSEPGHQESKEASLKLDADPSIMNQNIENPSLQTPVDEVYRAGDKDMNKCTSYVLEDGKRLVVQVTQQPEVGSMDNINNGLENSKSDSFGTHSSSSGGMERHTLPTYDSQDTVNFSNFATNEHGDPHKGADLGEQLNRQTALLQTFDKANKNTMDGNLKFEKHLSQLLSLPHISSDEFSEHLLEGVRKTSNIETSINGYLTKQAEGLDAYDAYLADPSLSPSMKSQVSRAKAIAQKLYTAREG